MAAVRGGKGAKIKSSSGWKSKGLVLSPEEMFGKFDNSAVCLRQFRSLVLQCWALLQKYRVFLDMFGKLDNPAVCLCQ